MYKISVPISIKLINEQNIDIYLKQLRDIKADRVFLCGFGKFDDTQGTACNTTKKASEVINILRKEGYEVGIWISSLGHGQVLAHVVRGKEIPKYSPMIGINGESGDESYCPLDENFVRDLTTKIRVLARLHPDMIMLDDDFRMNTRLSCYMTCFCHEHMKEYYKRIGKEIPRNELEKLMFTGGRNKYRTAYLNMLGDDLANLAKTLRNAVDEIDSSIRMGSCLVHESWDLAGITPMEIAEILAGNNKPFFRISGAPYHDTNIISAVEFCRMQYHWAKDAGIEMFSEGDTYPRPRYNITSKVLELFDLALIADGGSDGMLNYIFDYTQPPDYETGYIDRYIRNKHLRDSISSMFNGKTSDGIRVFNVMRKIENENFGEELENNIVYRLQDSTSSPADDILAKNSIPTTFGDSDYPIFIAGENASYVSNTDLKNGAIIDIKAARILQNRGIDTGLTSAEVCEFYGEHYDDMRNLNNTSGIKCYKVTCNNNIKVLSSYLPDNTPSSYLYQNNNGIRFLVLAFDIYKSHFTANFANNYYRQQQIIDAVEWLCGKKLPAVCPKNPNLYIMTSRKDNTMSVALFNIHLDDVIDTEITLDKKYNKINFVNCSGTLNGDKVKLSDITPYGFAAFEVTE